MYFPRPVGQLACVVLQNLLSLKTSLTLTHACMLDRLKSILAGWLPSFQPDCRLMPACSRAIDQKLSLIHTKYISVISVNFAITATLGFSLLLLTDTCWLLLLLLLLTGRTGTLARIPASDSSLGIRLPFLVRFPTAVHEEQEAMYRVNSGVNRTAVV